MQNESIRQSLDKMTTVLDRLDLQAVRAAVATLVDVERAGGTVYTFGNGGSAATASHMAVDMSRRLRQASGRRIRVIALNDSVPWTTAVANDDSYAEVFAEPLRTFLRDDDLVVGISASGNSPNMVRAFEVASSLDVPRLALVGFTGGRLSELATQRIWVDSDDYGIVESAHVFIAHLLVDGLAEAHAERGVGMTAERLSSTRPIAGRSMAPQYIQ